MKTIITIITFVLIFISTGTQAQEVILSGQVVDKDDNPLQEVSVFSPNTKIGTITNEKGMFQLRLEKGPVEIEFSARGFSEDAQSLMLKTDTTLTVFLTPTIRMKSKQDKDPDTKKESISSKSQSNELMSSKGEN